MTISRGDAPAVTTFPLSPAALVRLIDHTILRPDATEADIGLYCEEAMAHRFHAVCVNPLHVKFAARQLAGTSVRTCSVIAFPFGASTSMIKAAEAACALADGATEIDMVIDIGALKEGRLAAVQADITEVRKAVATAVLKVIIETALLTRAEKIAACQIAVAAGADFVKTSTGYAGGGATVADVALIRETVGPKIGVKASGGIRRPEEAAAMIAAGANRLGSSASLALIGVNTH
jgi:deoxyribose-phosphate aldolase